MYSTKKNIEILKKIFPLKKSYYPKKWQKLIAGARLSLENIKSRKIAYNDIFLSFYLIFMLCLYSNLQQHVSSYPVFI